MAHHHAAWQGHPECLEVLIKAGCDVMAKDEVGDGQLGVGMRW